MAYTVNYTDVANKGSISVEDNTINQQTSLSIPGRNTTAYGTAIAENFLHLLENFTNSTAPGNPVEGQLWYDNTPGVDQLKLYDGTTWISASGLKKATNAPGAAQSVTGDLWVDTDNQQLYLYTGSGWVLVGPSFSDGLSTGVRATSITGTNFIKNLLGSECHLREAIASLVWLCLHSGRNLLFIGIFFLILIFFYSRR